MTPFFSTPVNAVKRFFGSNKEAQGNDSVALKSVALNSPADSFQHDTPYISLYRIDEGQLRHVMTDDIPAQEVKEEMEGLGFKNSGVSGGKASSLLTNLKSIYETYKQSIASSEGPSEAETVRLQGKIEQLRLEIDALQKREGRKRDQFNRDINLLEKDREELEQKRKEAKAKDLNSVPASKFMAYVIGVILVLVSVFVILFYANTAYRAFYGMAVDMNDPDEVKEAILKGSTFSLTTVWLSLLAVLPFLTGFVLMGLSLLVHYFSKKFKSWAPVISMIVITVAADALMAHRIHADQLRLNEMTGVTSLDTEWFSSTQFWLVFLIGISSAAAWGMLMYYFLEVLDEANPNKIIQKQLASYEAELKTLKEEIARLQQELDTLIEEIQGKVNNCNKAIVEINAKLKERIAVITYDGRLKLSLEAFNNGWHTFLAAGKMDHEECYQVFEQFKERYFPTEKA